METVGEEGDLGARPDGRPKAMSPVTVFVRLGLLFIAVEILVMLGLSLWAPDDLPALAEAVIDAAITALIVAPLGYLWVVRPFSEAAAAPQRRETAELRDIAKRLELSEARLRAVLDSALDCIVTMDHEGKVIAFNPSAEATFGYRRDEVVGKPLADLIIPEHLREAHSRGLRRYLDSGAATVLGQRLELTAMRRGGEAFPVELVITAVHGNGGPSFFAGFIRDITARRTAEETLARLAHHNELILEAAGEGIYGLDTEGRTTFVNAAAARMVGWAPEDLIGRPLHDIIHHSHADGHPYPAEECPNYAAFRDGETHEVAEELFWRKDGSSFPVSYVSTPILEDDGTLVGAVVVFQDISARKDAEEDLRRERDFSRSVIDSLPGIFYLIGEDGRFRLWNANFERVSGFDAAEMGERSALDFFEDEERKRIAAKIREVYVHGEAAVDAVMVTKDGRRLPYHFTGRRCAVSEGPCLVGMGIDISSRVAMEEALKASNQELEQFAYVASHDLQEPLRMITSYNQLLARQYGDRLDSDAHEFIGYAVEGAHRMQRLIRDLLEYSRVGRLGQPFGAVDLEAVMNEVMANLSARIEEQAASVAWSDLPTVSGDDSQLVRLLQNLVGNALKYGAPDRRRPEISVSATRAGGQWEIAVTDNGIGIDPSQFDRIFKIFQRLHGRGEYEGTGIGLSICQRIVERHGGRIWVDSTPGEGSTFHFTLPDQSALATDDATP